MSAFPPDIKKVIPEYVFATLVFSGNLIDSRDVVDGHREKTLSLLWKIIFAFQVCAHLC